MRAKGSRCATPGTSRSLRHCGYIPFSMHNRSDKGFGEGDAEPAPLLKEVYLLKELVGGSFTIHIKRKVVRKCQVAEFGSPLHPVVKFRLIQKAQKSVNKQNEQERGKGGTLSCARVHEDVCCFMFPDTDSHRSQVVEALEKINIRNPKLL